MDFKAHLQVQRRRVKGCHYGLEIRKAYVLTITYSTGMAFEISFARLFCICFFTFSMSFAPARAHIALTVAVSEIMSESGTTPMSRRSRPVSYTVILTLPQMH